MGTLTNILGSGPTPGKDLPKMIMFCVWLSETNMTIVRDSFLERRFL
jgi:hypothetical protein